MIKCLLSRPGLIAGPLHSTPLQNNSQSIPRLDPIDSKSSLILYLFSLQLPKIGMSFFPSEKKTESHEAQMLFLIFKISDCAE